jgi:hypothetical protein
MGQQQERYLIGPGLRDKLREVIARSDGEPLGTGMRGDTPVRLQDVPRRGGAAVRLGKTTAAWTKGTTATIELYEEGTPPSETKKTPTADTLTGCVNKFANVGSEKWVIVARGQNGYWYLIAAECG